MSNLLSHALTNLQDVESRIKSLKGLPTAATNIQNQSMDLISKAVPIIQQLQSYAKNFVDFTKPQIDKALSAVNGTSPLSEAKTLILEVQKGVVQLSGQVSSVDEQISDLRCKVTNFAKPLYDIESEINHQKETIQGKLNNARDNENAAHKKCLYLLALGPFGLIGLAAAAGLYKKWESEADGYAKQVSVYSAQSSHLSDMVNATTQLEENFVNLSNTIQGLLNGIQFLAEDTHEILEDIGPNNENRKTIAIYLIAAQDKINSLSADQASLRSHERFWDIQVHQNRFDL